MLTGKRLLIIEDAFLIALEIQSALEAAGAASVVLARDYSEAASLVDSFVEFDLAVVNAPRAGSGDIEVATRLRDAGVPVVICTAVNLALEQMPFGKVEIVTKPFLNEQLLSACRQALHPANR